VQSKLVSNLGITYNSSMEPYIPFGYISIENVILKLSISIAMIQIRFLVKNNTALLKQRGQS